MRAAVNVSTIPDIILAIAANVRTANVPFKHHLINANRVCGGGPLALFSGLIHLAGCKIIFNFYHHKEFSFKYVIGNILDASFYSSVFCYDETHILRNFWGRDCVCGTKKLCCSAYKLSAISIIDLIFYISFVFT